MTAVRNPFPGLRPFEPEDSTLFFGRDEQIGEAVDRLLQHRLLAVVGVSGCGKSSLVKAGMVPALQMGLAGNPATRWRVATMRPGDGPLQELSRCLGFGGAALVERTYGLLEAVETYLPQGENLLLVVDQFEEVFPYRKRILKEGGGSEADLFVSYLLRAAEYPSARVYVLLSMRSDYLGECAKFYGLPEVLNDGQYLVPRMTRQQLQEAIECPLEAAGVEVHPGVVQDLLNRCDEEPDNLPLLQHLLRRIFEEWERKSATGPITVTMTAAVGGLAEALDQDAEAVFGALSGEQQRIAEVLFRRITESRRLADQAEEDRPIRRPQTVEDLARMTQVEQSALRDDVVRPFAERGLLVVRSTDEGDKLDLPHECLCLRWKRLKDWVRAEAEDAKTLRFLLDVTERKTLLTGLALTQALDLTRDERLAWCLRYLAAEQIKDVVAWVKDSEVAARSTDYLKPQPLDVSEQKLKSLEDAIFKSPLDDNVVLQALSSINPLARIPAYLELRIRPREPFFEQLLDCFWLEFVYARRHPEHYTRPLWQLLRTTGRFHQQDEKYPRNVRLELSTTDLRRLSLILNQTLEFLQSDAALDPGGQCKRVTQRILNDLRKMRGEGMP